MSCSQMLRIALGLSAFSVGLGVASTAEPTTRPAGVSTAPAIPTYSFPRPTTAPATPESAGGITEAIYTDALDWFDRAEKMVDKLVPVAEQAADRILASGPLSVDGNPGFFEELNYRAGGLTFIRPGVRTNKPNSVIVLGHFRPNDTGMRWERLDEIHRFLHYRNPMVIHIASHRWPQVARVLPMADAAFWDSRLHRIDTGAPPIDGAKGLALGQMATAALAWVLDGEILAAATRRGKTLATYASDHEPGGKEWDRSVSGYVVLPDRHVPPIPAGRIGREYLRICRRQVKRFLDTQPSQVRLAAGRLAGCMRRDGMVWLVTTHHIDPEGALVPRDLRLLRLGREYNYKYFGEHLPKGDMLLYLGYLDYPEEAARIALDRGCDVVTMSVEKGPTDPRRTHIQACWDKYDTVIALPDYPIRVLPTSGVVGTLQWYAILAETEAAYRSGRKAPEGPWE